MQTYINTMYEQAHIILISISIDSYLVSKCQVDPVLKRGSRSRQQGNFCSLGLKVSVFFYLENTKYKYKV